jgi:serine/threonine-protein kinase RsbW
VVRSGSLALTIDSQLENVCLVGLTINKICSEIPMSEVEAYQSELCVVEAVNNAIKHAYADEPGHPIEVLIALEAERITFKVCDCGRSMEPRMVQLPATSLESSDDLAESGRGLFIIHAFMDHVSYTKANGKNVLTLVKDLKRSGGR